MAEAVRLVIWDLDETYWRGTLTEGGIQEYVQSHHDVVMELARRGIMSSICSKNDYDVVRGVLVEHGIWDTFVFPSIDWSPKGGRLKSIVEAVQLRPETILFIDDNALNRAEAEAVLPGLQIADETIIPAILSSPLFRGKDDSSLSRLKQYKLLEKRREDMLSTGEDNIAFLRSSNIRVTIEADIEGHIDRALELITRTNQLNFTKVQMPTDPDEAKTALLEDIRKHDRKGGLVRVTDKYGDYGYVGFFLLSGYHNKYVRHFCFSCRTLGMGIESWLYDRLGRPEFRVKGSVLTDLSVASNVDWINVEAADKEQSSTVGYYPRIRLRGGCEMQAVTHYFGLAQGRVIEETNYVRDGLYIRADSTENLRLGAPGLNAALEAALSRIGLRVTDFQSQFLSPGPDGTLLICSPWCDYYGPVYEHKTLDLKVMFNIHNSGNVVRLSVKELTEQLDQKKLPGPTKSNLLDVGKELRENYTFRLGLGEDVIRDNMAGLIRAVPRNMQMILLLPHEIGRGKDGNLYRHEPTVSYNGLMRSIAGNARNITLVDVADAIESDSEIESGQHHFHRMVYYRLYQMILKVSATAMA